MGHFSAMRFEIALTRAEYAESVSSVWRCIPLVNQFEAWILKSLSDKQRKFLVLQMSKNWRNSDKKKKAANEGCHLSSFCPALKLQLL